MTVCRSCGGSMTAGTWPRRRKTWRHGWSAGRQNTRSSVSGWKTPRRTPHFLPAGRCRTTNTCSPPPGWRASMKRSNGGPGWCGSSRMGQLSEALPGSGGGDAGGLAGGEPRSHYGASQGTPETAAQFNGSGELKNPSASTKLQNLTETTPIYDNSGNFPAAVLNFPEDSSH